MENKISFLNKNEYVQKNIYENTQIILYAVLALTIPIILQGQLLVGSIINTLLVLSALHITGKKLYALILMPSIGVLISGAIFGQLTHTLLFLIPSIWLGNAFLVLGYKYLRFQKNMNKIKSITLSITGKVLIISITASILYLLNVIPATILIAMTLIQLITATIGALSAFSINKLITKNN